MIARQAAFLDGISYEIVANSEIDISEIAQKEAFRQYIEQISRDAIVKHEQEQNAAQDFPPASVELKCFGSLSSGFATKASDMDLGLLSPLSKVAPDAADSPIPRLLEKALLDAGLGARLLTRTRVPIIKLCQNPPEKLRQGLLEEREKWESGLTHDLIEDDDHDDVAAQVHDDEPADAALHEGGTADTEFELPCGTNGATQRFHLRQGSKSLPAYYNLAKRVLRKAGGRDVSMLNYRDFSTQDWAILDGICQAFIRGLSDAHLKQHLAQYPSLRFGTGYPPASHRSLAGVFSQVEGEHILQTWDAWPAKQEVRAQSNHAEQVLRTWEETLRKTTFALDPILYTKEIQYSLDKLKRLPFIQLVTLEQGQHETPAQYHARAKLVIRSTQTQGHELSSAVTQAIVDQYVAGIFYQEVRDAVQSALADTSVTWDIETVSRRHKSLHLAREFERALNKGLYDETCANEVREYVTILRGPLQCSKGDDGVLHYLVPRPTNGSVLLSKIRSLEDPHNLEPNQSRDRYHDRLEFPKTGAGIQCDINFSAHLALQNTLLLRCYSHSDPRVKPMVLFVKHWAKVRGINSGYRGTLSSYGYVLMVLHYLVNVAQPFVCPNLQKLAQPPPPNITPAEVENTVRCKGYDIQFWRNEAQILQLAHDNQLNHNNETIGQLLRGFFEYFAHSGPLLGNGSCRGFDWGRDVLSLRTHGGLLSKQEKGWTGARTVLEVQSPAANPQDHDVHTGLNEKTSTLTDVVGSDSQQKQAQSTSKQSGVKEVRHRYLFAIEDPFELGHNVARTVTHNGIVSIRDEFRRAWAILQAAGRDQPHDDLLKSTNEVEEGVNPFSQLLDELHGPLDSAATNA
jgi:terminal uridylyltransferase